MYYVYVLRRHRDGKLHVGHTGDLDKRIELHNNCEGVSGEYRIPYEIVYYEACTDKRDALKRESYLRGAYGRRFLQNRLSNFLATT
jgi:putative endonuclease